MLESSLFRQLRPSKAKAVYIPNNSNSNKRSIVLVYFKNEEECLKVQKKQIYYYSKETGMDRQKRKKSTYTEILNRDVDKENILCTSNSSEEEGSQTKDKRKQIMVHNKKENTK